MMQPHPSITTAAMQQPYQPSQAHSHTIHLHLPLHPPSTSPSTKHGVLLPRVPSNSNLFSIASTPSPISSTSASPESTRVNHTGLSSSESSSSINTMITAHTFTELKSNRDHVESDSTSLDTLATCAMMITPEENHVTEVAIKQSQGKKIASVSVSESTAADHRQRQPPMKSKLPMDVATHNHSTYMSEIEFIRYFQRCHSLSEAVGAIGHDWPSYKSVSVYARARRLQLKYDSHGNLLLQGKAKQFVDANSSSSLTSHATSESSRRNDHQSNSISQKRAPVRKLKHSDDMTESDSDEEGELDEVIAYDESSNGEEEEEAVKSVTVIQTPILLTTRQLVPGHHQPRETQPHRLAPVTPITFPPSSQTTMGSSMSEPIHYVFPSAIPSTSATTSQPSSHLHQS